MLEELERNISSIGLNYVSQSTYLFVTCGVQKCISICDLISFPVIFFRLTSKGIRQDDKGQISFVHDQTEGIFF